MSEGRNGAGEWSRFSSLLTVLWWRGLAMVLVATSAVKHYDGATRLAIIVVAAFGLALTGWLEIRRARRRDDSMPTTNWDRGVE